MNRPFAALVLLSVPVLLTPLARAELELTSTASVQPTSATPPTVTTTSPATTGQDGDLLKFRNLDTLHGTILSATPDTGLRWQRSDLKAPILFGLANLFEIQLAPRPPRTPRTLHKNFIELSNGDRLAGDITSLTGDALTFNTWYAGSLKIKRSMIQSLSCSSALQNTTYAGPTGLEDWTSAEGSTGAWTFKKGAFYSTPRSGTIGRDVNIPDVASIDFDIAWRGQLYLNVAFCTDNLRDIYRNSAYMLQLCGSSANLNRMVANRGSNNMGSGTEIQNLRNNTKAHFAIKINKPKKTISLFADNVLVKQWTDGDDFAGKGKGLVFFSQGSSYQSRISNIRVAPWDGRTDSEDTTPAATTEDTVRLANNDKVSGMVTGIKKGEVILKTSFADMNIPLERVLRIDFASSKSERARRQPNDIRASFLDGSLFTLSLETLDESALVGSTENCGHASAAIDAFSRVQFHIYDKAPESDEDDWDAKPGDPRLGRGVRVQNVMTE